MTTDLVRLTDAAQMLAEARTLPDIRKVHNLAQRAQEYARAARLGLDAQNSAAAIALEAEARAGELLKRMADTGERATRASNLNTGPNRAPLASEAPPATLDDLGITEHESRTWQAVATVPAPVRAEYVARSQERDQEVTRVGLLRHAGIKPDPKAKPADLPTTDAHRAMFPRLAAAELTADLHAAMGHVRTEKCSPSSWADRIERMRPEDIEDMRAKVARVRRWADEWDALLAPRPLSVVGGSK